MPQTQTRRRVLTAIAAISAVTLPAPRLLAAEPAAEITSVRFGKIPVICFAPQYVCEELLRAEGFTEIRYVNAEPVNYSADLGRGKYDFCANVTPAHIARSRLARRWQSSPVFMPAATSCSAMTGSAALPI